MLRISIIKELAHWIENHLEEPLDVKRVASKSGYSQWHLQRLFKDITGDSLALYIRKKRLQNAAFELKQSKRTIAASNLSECNLEYGFHARYFGMWKKCENLEYH